MKRVATFSRVSTLDQHSSIENQEKVFQQWFENNKGFYHYKSYIDEGISGAKGYKRIQWNRMIKDGGEGRFDVLLCKSFSRFGRNQRETLDAINKLRVKNIRIIFLEDNLDSARDFANFGLMAWLAEKEANATSERIKVIWHSFNIEGKVHTPVAPYGYYYNKDKKNYFVNKEEAKVIKYIFSLYLEGYGYNGICNKLIEKGIKTKRGGTWQGNTIGKILKNEFYLGTLVQGKTRTIDATVKENIKIDSSEWYRHKNNHEAIIEEDIFYEVNKKIKERGIRAKKSQQHNKTSTRNSNKALFSNLLVCGHCGSKMYIKRRKKENYKNCYNCLAYERQGTKCGHKSNRYIEDHIKMLIKFELEDLSENNLRRLQNIKSKKVNKVQIYEKELKKINKAIDKELLLANNLLSNYSKNLVEEELYKLQNSALNNRIKELLKEKESLKLNIDNEYKKEDKENIFNAIEKILNLPMEQWTNAMLKEIISEITLRIDGTIKLKVKYFD
ncbi:recombinase family protein [Clostridium massiliamazoniense]|uniref:recombinase family protein n=1 Tax=Clostridium massiliamazoniense TaxID=1347366 RepID=UPI0006D85A35|nr:recombinase family protein [Clostridium massiliamazoniense]